MEHAELQSLIVDLKRRPLYTSGPSAFPVFHDRGAVEKVLAPPVSWLLIDAIDGIDLERRRIRGRLTIPGAKRAGPRAGAEGAAFPGGLQLEALAQLALCLAFFLRSGDLEISPGLEPIRGRAIRVHHAAYLNAPMAGDRVCLAAALVGGGGLTTTCAGQVLKDDVVAALAIQELYLPD